MNTEQIFDLIGQESKRQEDEICLIASENYMSENVMRACGSILINKYSEGFPPKYDEDGKLVKGSGRYYGGCHIIDQIENIAIENAKKLFNCNFANVQPNSGCQANQAVYLAFLKSNDTILAMSIDEGGHISHSLSTGFGGTFYDVHTYGIDDNGLLNYNEIKAKLYAYSPKLLIVGASAYPREINFKLIREMVDEYNKQYATQLKAENDLVDTIEEIIEKEGCKIMVDMAHIAGLVATGDHMSPLPYADVVTSTVQKTLRSGRGGLILWNNEKYTKKINSAIFPRLQGGPLQNMIAGKAIGFAEALQPEFKEYNSQILKNIKAMEKIFRINGVKMISGGSDNHLILIDLKDTNISGKELEESLEKIGIITNKNAVKDDPRPKTETSGIRIGTAAITTRGAKEEDCEMIAEIISMYINGEAYADSIFEEHKRLVKEFCESHPIYGKKDEK